MAATLCSLALRTVPARYHVAWCNTRHLAGRAAGHYTIWASRPHVQHEPIGLIVKKGQTVCLMNLDKRLLQQTQAVRLHLALTVGAGLLLGIAIVLQAYLLSGIVALVFLQGYTLDGVQGLLGALLAAIVARSALVYLRDVSAAQAAIRIKTSLRERLFGHLLELGPLFSRGERTGELVNTAMEGIESLDAYFSQYLPNLVVAALIPLSILAFVFPIDLLSGTVFLLTAPLIPLFMVLIGKAAEALTRKQWTALSRMSAHFLDVLQGLTTLKLLGRSREQAGVILEISNRYRQATMKVLRVAFLSALALELLATLSTAIVAVEVGLRLLYGHLPFQEAFFILILAPEFYLPLRALGASFHAGMSGVAAAQRIFSILETSVGNDWGTGRRGETERVTPSPTAVGEGRGEGTHSGDQRALTLTLSHRERGLDISDRERGYTIPVSPRLRVSLSPSLSVPPSPRFLVPPSPAIRFEDVHYAYDDGRRPALNGVSFEITPGQKVALVGPSGSGKSTVAQLLLRFMEPDRGKILIGGLPLSEIPAWEWRREVAWVPQVPYLFHATVAENLRMARPEAAQDELEEAARRAHAHQFIRELPRGYDTVIGERGERLSGGQAQRLSLARAYLKNAPILILDEATSHLDPELESRLMESMDRLMEGRTVLVIAHRLGTASNADRILVLSDGRVVESGSHEELVGRGCLYSRLVAAGVGMREKVRLIDTDPKHACTPSQKNSPISPAEGEKRDGWNGGRRS